MKKMNYTFSVPDNKRVRMIVSTDCKNEADDQFALAHHLMTPMFILKGIVPCHFNMFSRDYGDGHTAQASMDEVNKVLDLMDRQRIGISDEGRADSGRVGWRKADRRRSHER